VANSMRKETELKVKAGTCAGKVRVEMGWDWWESYSNKRGGQKKRHKKKKTQADTPHKSSLAWTALGTPVRIHAEPRGSGQVKPAPRAGR
jgi:hypothetical protein